MFQIRSSHSRCSGFISTDRRQVIVSRSRAMPAPARSKKAAGSSASARCRPRRAASSKSPRARAEDAPAVAARTAQTTMSSSGSNGDQEARVRRELRVEREGRLARRGQPPRELAALLERQQAHRRPERHGARARPRALEADLAQVQVGRAEVRVRRVVLVEPPDRRVAEEDAAAAVGLQAVLVRIDHDRVGLADAVEGAPRRRAEVVREAVVAAVRRVGVQPEAAPLPQRQDLGQRIHRSRRRRAHRRDDRADAALVEPPRERVRVEASARIARDLLERRDPARRRRGRACSAPATKRGPPGPGGAARRPTAPRGWPSCRRRRGGRGADRRPIRTSARCPRPLRAPSPSSRGRRRARGCSG